MTMSVANLTPDQTEPAMAAGLPDRIGSAVFHVSLIDVATQLAWRKWLIVKATIASVIAGGLLCLVLPVRYTATTKILTPQQTASTASLLMNQFASAGSSSLVAMAGQGLGLKNPNDMYVGMLKSRPVADALIHKFSLAALYHAKDMTAARKKLADRTTVVSEKEGFIAISVSDPDKKRAAELANDYTQELRTVTKDLAVTEASQRRLFYEGQLNEAKSALVGAEMAFQLVQQKKGGLVQPDAQAKAVVEGLAALRAQTSAKQVELETLRSYSTEHSPEVQITERELSSLQGETAHMEERSRASGFGDLSLHDVPGAGMEYLRAEHELRYRQAIFDLLMKQYDAARLDEAKEAAVIQVLEPAIDPDRKSSPRYALTLLLFAAAGICIGCLLTLFSCWKELLHSDPYLARQMEELKCAVRGRRISTS
jgi:tyrosine-protein kinase Etk/Wzc